MNQVNLRAGVRNKRFSVEGYVTNLFNNRSYYNVGTGADRTYGNVAGTYGALIAQLRELRTIGIRTSFTL
jgi:iron complex outermembrane receptor protein